MTMKKVAITGAGISGIVNAKESLEAGLLPVNFEQHATPGGVWNKDPAIGKTWNDMRVNQSKQHMGFSDYLWQKDLPDFVTNRQFADYLQGYTDYFGVSQHIRYNQRITHIGYKNNQFIISCGKEKEAFDKLVLSSGVFSQPLIKNYKDENKFQGLKLHSQFYKNAEDFKNHEVIVEGRSLSAYEIASDLAVHGVKVHHVFSRAAYVIPRMLDNNGTEMPFDLFFYRYSNNDKKPDKEKAVASRNRFLFQKLGNHGLINPALSVNPESGFPEHAVISDHYINMARSGMINAYHDRISHFESDGVTLESGRRIKATVSFIASGYTANLPPMDKSIAKALGLRREDNWQPITTYKGTLVEGLPGLSCTGLTRGPSIGVMELQARYIAGINSGQIDYPSAEKIKAGVEEELILRNLHPKPGFPRDYVSFMLELARDIGVVPKEYKQAGQQMIPGHFRENGIGAKPEIARQQHQRLMDRLSQ